MGIKVTEDIVNGFQMIVTDYFVEGVTLEDRKTLHNYEKLPIEVKVTIRTYESLMEAGEGDEKSRHSDSFEDIFIEGRQPTPIEDIEEITRQNSP